MWASAKDEEDCIALKVLYAVVNAVLHYILYRFVVASILIFKTFVFYLLESLSGYFWPPQAQALKCGVFDDPCRDDCD